MTVRQNNFPSFRLTALAVLAFGIAMGYLEAAVVVYLRAALGAAPAGLPPVGDGAAFAVFESTEIVRELATLVMIAALGWLAGRSKVERLAWAAVVFGSWDIVYYVGLRLLIGWPLTPDTWDVLFLFPSPWVSPIWAPMLVSAALVGFGLLAARRPTHLGPWPVVAGLAGGGLVIASFLVDADRVVAGNTDPWTGWPVFWAGMAIAAVGAWVALAGRRVAV